MSAAHCESFSHTVLAALHLQTFDRSHWRLSGCCSLQDYAHPSLNRCSQLYTWLSDTRRLSSHAQQYARQVAGPAQRCLAKAGARRYPLEAFLLLDRIMPPSVLTCCTLAARVARVRPPSFRTVQHMYSGLRCFATTVSCRRFRASELPHIHAYYSSAQLHGHPLVPPPYSPLQACSSPLPPPVWQTCL